MRFDTLLARLARLSRARYGEDIAIGLAPDGSVSASTDNVTLVVGLSSIEEAQADVVMSVQTHIGAAPVEIERYPLRDLLARLLFGMRSARRRDAVDPLPRMKAGPRRWRQAQRIAMAQFIHINFDSLMLIAHLSKWTLGAHSRLRAPFLRRRAWIALG